MKKIIYSIFATLLISISANAQISFDNVGTKNTFPKYIGQTKIGNSTVTEGADSTVYSTYNAIGTATRTAGSALTVNGTSVLKAVTTNSTSYSLIAENSAGNSLLRVRGDGAIYTGTLQGVSTSTFVAGSNTITVTNGIITNVQ